VEIDGVAYRPFQNGIVILNDSMDNRRLDLPLPDNFKPDRLLDLFDGSRTLRVKGGKIRLNVPRKMARVYLSPEILGR
jgi:hypothetical protein